MKNIFLGVVLSLFACEGEQQSKQIINDFSQCDNVCANADEIVVYENGYNKNMTCSWFCVNYTRQGGYTEENVILTSFFWSLDGQCWEMTDSFLDYDPNICRDREGYQS